MKRLRFFAGINEKLFQESNLKDKKLMNMLSLMIPISAIIAGLAFYTFVKFFTESFVLATFVGTIIFLVFLWHDQSLMSTDKLGQIYGRILGSLAIACFITIPFKANQMHDVITEKIIHETELENADVRKVMLDKIEAIEEEGQKINEKMTEASRNRQYDSQVFYDTRREQQAFNETKAQRIEDIKNTYEAMMKKPEVSKFDILGHYANNMFSKDSPSELFINLAIIVFLIFLEASPAIVRLTVEGGEYMKKRDHIDALRKMINEKIRVLETKMIQEDKNIPEIAFQIAILKEKLRLLENHFENLHEIIQLVNTVEMIKQEKTPESSKNGQHKPEPDEDEVPEFQFS